MERNWGKPGKSLSRWRVFLVAVVSIVAVAQQTLWVDFDATQARDDDANLFAMSLCLEDYFRGDLYDSVMDCLPRTPYPPLVPAVASIHYIILGNRSISLAVQSLWPFYVLLVVSLFLGVRGAAGDLAGLAAAALGPVLATAHFLRASFFAEVPLMALVIASVVCMVGSRGLTRVGYSLGLGICLGLGLLTKWTFAFFLGPPMALFVAVRLFSVVKRGWLGAIFSTFFVVATGAMVLCASGRWPGGWSLALILAFAVAAGWVFLAVRWPGELEDGAGRTALGLIVCGVALAVLALPWYLATLDVLRAFLTSNLGHQFAGDVIPWRVAWPYYPATLLTRALGTPLLVLLVLGIIRQFFPGRAALCLWCLFVFLCGMVLLTVSPYRTSRYLAAGFGVLVPLMVPGLGRARWLAVPLYSLVLTCSLFYQISWISPKAGGMWVPAPAVLRMPPQRELFGNVRRGIVEAEQALRHPRWYSRAVALGPVGDAPPTGKLIDCMSKRSGEGVPFFALLWDPDGQANADVIRIAGLAKRVPRGSRTQSGQLAPSPERLVHELDGLLPPSWRQLRDFPRNFFVITVSSQTGARGREYEALGHFLSGLNFRPVLRDKISDRNDYVVRVWQVNSTAAEVVLPVVPRAPGPGK